VLRTDCWPSLFRVFAVLSLDSRQSWWKIRIAADEQYYICPLDDPNLCWNLREERDSTPVSLQRTSADPRCLWMISPHDPQNVSAREFLRTLKVRLNSAEPTNGRGDFPVRIDVERMPPSSIIRILDPVSVVFGGHVIAEVLVPNVITAHVAILSATFRLLDRTGFLAFATSVLQNKIIQVELKAGRLNLVSGIASEEQTAVYWMDKTLIFKGFNLFREQVKIRDVKITGSSGSEYLNATAVATITNSSLIDITVSVTAAIYYRQIKIGVAVINTLHLQHGDNTQLVEWRLDPPRADEDVRGFLNRYIITGEAIPISLRVEDICPIICNHPFNLPSFEVDSSIPGLKSRPVSRVDAYLGWVVFWNRTIAFTFEFENPVDCELTIVSIELEAFVHGQRLVTVRHSFDSFIIPARGSKKSPRINDAHLLVGYLEAFQLVSEGTTMDVEVISTSFRVGDVELHGLKFNLKDIPLHVSFCG